MNNNIFFFLTVNNHSSEEAFIATFYRQHIHECSSPWNPNWPTAVSQLPADGSPPLALLPGLVGLQILCLPWVDSAGNDSPYPSLNTALLASQPCTRRFCVSRLAPILNKMLSSYIKLESHSPEGFVFCYLINKSYYEMADPS